MGQQIALDVCRPSVHHAPFSGLQRHWDFIYCSFHHKFLRTNADNLYFPEKCSQGRPKNGKNAKVKNKKKLFSRKLRKKKECALVHSLSLPLRTFCYVFLIERSFTETKFKLNLLAQISVIFMTIFIFQIVLPELAWTWCFFFANAAYIYEKT